MAVDIYIHKWGIVNGTEINLLGKLYNVDKYLLRDIHEYFQINIQLLLQRVLVFGNLSEIRF